MRQEIQQWQYKEHKIGFARTLRKNMTPEEKILWKALRKRRVAGVKFRRQVALGSYIADFLSYERRLVIEVDGPIHDARAEYDRERNRCWEEMGFAVLRFRNDQVRNSLAEVVRMIECVVEKRKVLPSAPHP